MRGESCRIRRGSARPTGNTNTGAGPERRARPSTERRSARSTATSWRRTRDESPAPAQEARRIFERYPDGGCRAASRRAVLGIFLPGLYYPDRERARRLPERTPSSERAKIAFWDGYVSGKMYSHALEDLAGCDEFMDWPVAQNPDLARTQEAAAGHAMLAYFCDLAHADGIVERVLQKNDQGAAGLRAGRPRPGRQARRSGLQVKAGRPVEAPLPEKPQPGRVAQAPRRATRPQPCTGTT